MWKRIPSYPNYEASSGGQIRRAVLYGHDLSDEQISAMQKEIDSGLRQVDIAARFGVSQAFVSKVKRGIRKPRPMKVLAQAISTDGRMRVHLWHESKRKCAPVHRLVCEAFHGPPPSRRSHAAHNNGNCLDNRAENLRWATKLENEADKIRHGTKPIGSQHGGARLNEQEVAFIKYLRSKGAQHKQLARWFHVSVGAISAIDRGLTWTHVDPAEY